MLGPPIDAWYVWLGVSVVALAVLGVATTAIPSEPSQSESIAETIDTVAASEPPASAAVPIDAERVRVAPHRVSVEDDDGDAAIVERGPITPARRGTELRAIALGTPPAAAFRSPERLQRAAERARTDERVLEPTGGELIVRSVRWENVNVTLVAV